MDFDEIRVRTRQELTKRCDAVLQRTGLLRHPAGDQAVNSATSGRFFFTTQEVPAILSCVRDLLPGAIEETIRRADRICQHRFDLLGYEDVDYGPEIDWHLDAVHGKRAPRRPWFKVRYLDFDQVGDSKVTWELNRHQHLVTLAKAYRMTGNIRYPQELFRQWYQWQAQNPYPIGINWASSLEVAFRSLSWLWVWHLLEGEAIVPQQFCADLRRALALSARHIERFLSTYFSPNTHLLGEAVALFFIGTLCAELPPAKRWQRVGWQIAVRQAQRQVQPDGTHFEHSLYYHTYALDFFLHARILAGLNGVPVPSSFDHAIEKMLAVLSSLGAAGPLPRLGDDDGGRVFDPRRNQTEHLLDPLATGAMLYKRNDFNEVAGGPREETLWLLGTDRTNQAEGLPSQKKHVTSFALDHAGIYVMAGSKSARQRLLITASPQGPGRTGHRHADALSVQVAVNGQELLIDPGTFTYIDPAGDRNRFRETSGHNTLVVDSLSQAEPGGPFAWKALPDARVERWVTGNSFDLFTASHAGYERLDSPVRHERHVFHFKPRFWLIRDVVEGTGTHQFELCWHFAPGALSAIPGGAHFVANKEAGLGVLFASNQPCSQQISTGPSSPVYGRQESSPILRLSGQVELPTENVTVLLPLHKAAAYTGAIGPFEDENRNGVAVRAYRYDSAGTIDYIFFADEARPWQLGSWSSDARFLFCSMKPSGESIEQLIVCEASYVELDDHRIFNSALPVSKMEWSRPENQRSEACVA